MDAETLGRRWLDARLASGRTVQDVADELKINRNNLYRLEKGANDVTLRMMQKVATAYGTNLGEIFREGEAPQRTPREFWPLLDVLQPLTPDQRERIISNVASNLHFVSAIYATSTPTEKEISERVRLFNDAHPSKTDSLEPPFIGNHGVSRAARRIPEPTEAEEAPARRSTPKGKAAPKHG